MTNRLALFTKTKTKNNTMKRFLNSFIALALAASLLLVTTGCDRLNDIQPEPTTSGAARIGTLDIISNTGFDTALFASKIEAQLTGKVAGFGYRIIVNGQPYTAGTGGRGFARYLGDAPLRAYTPDVRMDIGGGSQYLSALSVLKLLETYKVPLTEKVWSYLPVYFKPSDDFKKITFRDLLTHTSGIVNYNKFNTAMDLGIEDVQESVEKGIYDQGEGTGGFSNGNQPYGQYGYQPMNYAVLRWAIVYLVAKKDPSYGSLELLQRKENRPEKEGLEHLVYQKFMNYIQFDILIKSGWEREKAEDIWADPIDYASLVKYYPLAIPNAPGTNTTPFGYRKMGADFLFLSADELAKLMAAVRAGKVVSTAVQNQMKIGDGKQHQIGFDDTLVAEHGTTYFKKGGASGGNSIMLHFEGPQVNVQLAITTNTANGLVTNAQTWVTAFDASFK